MVNSVIIIGGGVAGLACARRLHEAGLDFKLISQDIGGRIQESPNHKVNYGAYYVTDDYAHVKQLVQLQRRILPIFFEFHHQHHNYPLLSWRLVTLLPQYLRFRRLLREFRQHLVQLRQDSAFAEQASLIESDKYLRTLFYQPAPAFIKEHHLEDWFEYFMEEPLYATGFVGVHEAQAFDLLWLAQPLIVPTYQYSFSAELVAAPWRKQIVLADVTALDRAQNHWRVTLSTGQTLEAGGVVVATGTQQMQKLVRTTEGREPVNAYLHHIEGTLKPAWRKHRYNVFEIKSNIITVTTESDGTHLVYSRTPEVNLDEYFLDYKVIAEKAWVPAFHVLGAHLVKQVRGSNLYVAGEHNICNLEDSYITGLFAANQIIAQQH